MSLGVDMNCPENICSSIGSPFYIDWPTFKCDLDSSQFDSFKQVSLKEEFTNLDTETLFFIFYNIPTEDS